MSQVRILSPRPLNFLDFLAPSPRHLRIWSQLFCDLVTDLVTRSGPPKKTPLMSIGLSLDAIGRGALVVPAYRAKSGHKARTHRAGIRLRTRVRPKESRCSLCLHASVPLSCIDI